MHELLPGQQTEDAFRRWRSFDAATASALIREKSAKKDEQ